MVCLELVRVTDGFLRDRDRKRAFPPPSQRPRLDRKSSRVRGFRDPSDPRAIGTGLHRGGIAPVENSVTFRQLLGFDVPSIRAAGGVGPNVARFLINRIGLNCSLGP
jgi:hypothetical protein